MDANRIGLERHEGPVHGRDAALVHHLDGASDHDVRVVDHGAGLASRDELPVALVGPIGKNLERNPQPERASGLHHFRVRKREQDD